MYIAMNRFKISLGSEAAFEKVWRDRDSHLWMFLVLKIFI